MTLFDLLYPSERKACREAGISNCHFHDLTIYMLSTIRFKRLIEFSAENEANVTSHAHATLRELWARINSYHKNHNYFFNKAEK